MKLPNAEQAVGPSRKITHSLLATAHRDGRHKAEFFRSFGFKLEAWEELASALLNHARHYEVVEIVPTPFGRNFVMEGTLPAPDGRSPNVYGDAVYLPGNKLGHTQTLRPSDPPLCLHAWRIAFLHPLHQKPMKFCAPPPAWAGNFATQF